MANFCGSNLSTIRLYNAGSSLRWLRSPAPPKMHNRQGGKLRRDHGAPSGDELGRGISKVLVWVSGMGIILISGYVEYGRFAMNAARIR